MASDHGESEMGIWGDRLSWAGWSRGVRFREQDTEMGSLRL